MSLPTHAISDSKLFRKEKNHWFQHLKTTTVRKIKNGCESTD